MIGLQGILPTCNEAAPDGSRMIQPAFCALIGSWLVKELADPGLCFLCVYLGVVSTTLLPTTAIYFLQLPTISGLFLSPLASIPIAIRVFDRRAYRRWHNSSKAVLGVRMLRACSDGIQWARRK